MVEIKSAEILREIGKAYFFGSADNVEKKKDGLQMIIDAKNQGDSEASFIVGKMLLDGFLSASGMNSVEHALELIRFSAKKGYMQARVFLNTYCEKKYEEKFSNKSTSGKEGPLTGFNGKPLSFVRKGIWTPIDAVLEYKNGKNVLTLSANVSFMYYNEIANTEMFEKAVIDGIMMWQGEYEVFGGQKVSVKVDVTTNNNVYDNVVVMPITDDVVNLMMSVCEKLPNSKYKQRIKELYKYRRSFAISGFRWSVRSRKLICLQSEENFEDYEEIMHVTKHEFGHALGLGDLYKSAIDYLPGVKKGTYAELDSYALNDTLYNLVMCDHRGPISNNDIEMLILAFKENKPQLFQTKKSKGKISYALGRGN